MKKYYYLLAGEIVQEGDQYLDGKTWYNCYRSIGAKIGSNSSIMPGKVRRLQ
jgi:hypothetical protein